MCNYALLYVVDRLPSIDDMMNTWYIVNTIYLSDKTSD